MARPKPTPLKIVEDEADRIRALYRRFANTSWMEAMNSDEVRNVGLGPTDYAKVFEILREPLYRGAIRYGKRQTKTLIEYEPYRLVDDDLWNRAVDGLPMSEGPAKTKSENALQILAETLDQASTVRAVVKAFKILCPGNCKGRGRLRFDGVANNGGVRVPLLRCNLKSCQHRTPLLTSLDLVTLAAKFRCLDCDASTLADFQQTYDSGGHKYTVRCLQCNWKVVSKKAVFSELDRTKLAPLRGQVPKGQQRLIPGPAQPRQAPGRRKSKAKGHKTGALAGANR